MILPQEWARRWGPNGGRCVHGYLFPAKTLLADQVHQRDEVIFTDISLVEVTGAVLGMRKQCRSLVGVPLVYLTEGGADIAEVVEPLRVSRRRVRDRIGGGICCRIPRNTPRRSGGD